MRVEGTRGGRNHAGITAVRAQSRDQHTSPREKERPASHMDVPLLDPKQVEIKPLTSGDIRKIRSGYLSQEQVVTSKDKDVVVIALLSL